MRENRENLVINDNNSRNECVYAGGYTEAVKKRLTLVEQDSRVPPRSQHSAHGFVGLKKKTFQLSRPQVQLMQLPFIFPLSVSPPAPVPTGRAAQPAFIFDNDYD